MGWVDYDFGHSTVSQLEVKLAKVLANFYSALTVSRFYTSR